MKLMFWKKKHTAEDNTENSQENPGDDVASQTPSDETDDDTDIPVKPGLMARLSSKFTVLSARFRKSPATNESAEESSGDDTPEHTENESSDTEDIPEKPGLFARVKVGFAALLGRFGKSSPKALEAKEQGGKPQQSAENIDKSIEEQGNDSSQPAANKADDAEEGQKKPGFIKVSREKLAALLASLWPKLVSSGSKLLSWVQEYRNYLIGTLVLILLAGIIYAAWDIIFPPLVRKTTSSDPAKYLKKVPASAPVAAPTIEPEQNLSPQAEAEILKKRSEEAKAKAEELMKEAEELQKRSEEAKVKAEEQKKKEEEERAQAEALRKKKEEERAKVRNQGVQQQYPGSSDQQSAGNTTVTPGSNEWTAANKDPKATAKTLKEAIEAMNAASGGDVKRPAK